MAGRVVELQMSGDNIDLIARLSDPNPYFMPYAWRTQPGGQWSIGFQLIFEDLVFMLPVYTLLSYDEFRQWVVD